MNPTPEQIKKINHFSKLPSKMCAKIAAVVNIAECNAKEKLLSEGERGDTMGMWGVLVEGVCAVCGGRSGDRTAE